MNDAKTPDIRLNPRHLRHSNVMHDNRKQIFNKKEADVTGAVTLFSYSSP